VLGRALRSVRQASPSTLPPDSRFDDLTYGWNNDVWSASPAFMQEILRCALQTRGAILECGSGLSTLLLGTVAARTGSRVWSLEHDADWAERVRQAMAVHRVTAAEIRHAELRSFGEYMWYSTPPDALPRDIRLVVCDGPPGDTPGGRYGLLPVMRDRLAPGCIILLDDAGRPDEQRVLDLWGRELHTGHTLIGSQKPFARLTIPH
jgi:hypothetical protein